MAIFKKTKSGHWKALVFRRGWPQQIKTFRLKVDAQDWAREVEADMRRGTYIPATHAEKTTVSVNIDRY